MARATVFLVDAVGNIAVLLKSAVGSRRLSVISRQYLSLRYWAISTVSTIVLVFYGLKALSECRFWWHKYVSYITLKRQLSLPPSFICLVSPVIGDRFPASDAGATPRCVPFRLYRH